ncbi:T9SS type A sorting domain-containing protein [Flavobacterium sp. DG1-102-2]|uniref:T9SS type A sorting domain-containing protein n=1 Tax=Flavobacterium sp. DG1-102-2 TaxID=3081663 RepID=UPI00294900EB|nr:T9SS type A sorting domain-containing protein [Flavobacterium sp. DG1-102-2]MDV6169583.1 T9SS type A sorting domain-containing protein [Flavobacterium sp. DG1-102-2]
MKKNLLLVILAYICTTGLFAQGGMLDASFGTDGILNVPDTAGNAEVAYGVTVQDDGKILALGTRLGRVCVKRYNDSGTPDVSFGNQGEVIQFVGFNSHNPKEIRIQNDGKILVCGYLDTNHLFIMRFSSNGTPDDTFGTNGVVSYYPDFTANSRTLYPYCITVLNDGKIMAAGLLGDDGDSQWGMFAVKFNADGTPDSAYGYNGYFAEQAYGYTESAVCYPDGKVAFAILKSFPSLTGYYTVVKRLDQTGATDTSFGTEGITEITNGDRDYVIRDLALQADGKLVGGGLSSTSDTTGAEFTVMRLNYDGSPDASFGIDGKVIPFNPGNEEMRHIVVQPDGSIVGVGPDTNSYNFNLMRFSSSGMQDMSFGTNGVAKTSFGSYYHQTHDIAVQPDGKIIITGMVMFNNGQNNNFLLLRYSGGAPALGLNNNALNQFSVYPNPTSDMLYLANADELAVENISVYDISGKAVLSQNSAANQIDVEQLPQGMYFLKITTGNGTANHKFIKE